ncbi:MULTISPECIES: DUF456 domain-containing protein [Prosthecochloris]|uniref:DUF456 family protein n=1 Tax=Prosthecochloris vibrioformis TaxID=1098 RepID=A0A5C4S1H1_PROVB|nr:MULTISPECIES: DUF456 family protein [Prosthecochloris]ANT64493.1 hypothetical protein Ptc2401_00698 [Prosthecochloris sp. CIB 2401]TNJ37336.1 DUF456 family protein [Prosthecochloris vibrioformis]
MEEYSVILWGVALLLVILGIAGMFLPALPGILLVFAGLFCAAWAEGFMYVGQYTLLVLALLAFLGYALDFLAGAFGASRFGGGTYAFVGGAAGAAFGLFFGLPGVLLGPFLGAAAGEFYYRRDTSLALKAGVGAWIGIVLGSAARVAILFIMLGVFIIARLF